MSNAEEARRLVARAHTRPRSRLSTIPIVKVGDEYRAGALPIEWKDDLEPATRKTMSVDGGEEFKPIMLSEFLDELEASIEKSGGIENVMVMPDDMDPNKEVEKFSKRLEAKRARDFYREVLGWDV